MKIKIWIAMIAMLSLFNNYAFAWNDTLTHPHISRRAIESSSFDQYFKDRLKLADGKNEILNGRSLAEWLQYGAEMENDPDCRASNHFHNPYKPWLQAGLTDTVGVINWWCWATTDFPAEDISSNLVWATGYLNRSGTGLDFDSMAHNEWDSQSTREYFYTYLTGLDLYGIPAA